MAPQAGAPHEGFYSIEPDQGGYTLHITPTNGEKEKVQTFATQEKAQDYIAKSPDMDGYEYQEGVVGVPANPSHSKDFSRIGKQ